MLLYLWTQQFIRRKTQYYNEIEVSEWVLSRYTYFESVRFKCKTKAKDLVLTCEKLAVNTIWGKMGINGMVWDWLEGKLKY